jgi:hypothetical protein
MTYATFLVQLDWSGIEPVYRRWVVESDLPHPLPPETWVGCPLDIADRLDQTNGFRLVYPVVLAWTQARYRQLGVAYPESFMNFLQRLPLDVRLTNAETVEGAWAAVFFFKLWITKTT